MISKNIHRPAEIFHVLGHPARLAIVRGLLKDECNVSKIVDCLKIPQSTVSQHLTVLKAAGIIEGQRRGVKMCYQIKDKLVKKILKDL